MKYNPTLHKLSNGATVILDPVDTETTAVQIGFNTGSRDETPDKYGLTHFCEHMLCSGTKRFPTFKDIKDFMGYNGGYVGATTSSDTLLLYGRIVSKNLDKLIGVLSDQLQNSVFSPERIELERIVILDELYRAKGKKERQQTSFISRTLFNTDLFAFQTLGTEENIKSFTREQMLDWLAQRLSAKNCVITISGKINKPDAVLNQLERCFGFLPSHNVSENKKLKYTPAIAHNLTDDTKNVNIFIAFPKRSVETDKNKIANMCISRFKSYLNDELFEEVRQQNGLVYGIAVDALGNRHGVHFIETECAPQNVATVVGLIAKTCARVCHETPITDQWLQLHESRCQLGDADWLDSAERRATRLRQKYLNTGELYDFYGTVKIAHGLTATDVMEYTRGLFDGPISIITDGPSYDGDLAAIWKQNFPDSNVVSTLKNIDIPTNKNKQRG